MTVPDHQTLMAPALRALADGTEQPISQLRGVIAKQVELTDEDLKATLPSGSPLFAIGCTGPSPTCIRLGWSTGRVALSSRSPAAGSPSWPSILTE